MIRVDVNVNAASELLAADAYGPGALLRLESAPAATGPFTEVLTQALIAGTDAYTFWHALGSTSTWYRSRVSSSDEGLTSGYDEPFQVGARTTYADVADLVEWLPNRAAPRDANALRDALRRARDVIDARTGRDFFRHPQVSGDEVRTFDVGHGRRDGSRLVVPAGIVSVTTLEVRRTYGGTWATVDPADYRLDPTTPGEDEPSWAIEIRDEAGYRGSGFWNGQGMVRITGAFGFPRVPSKIANGSLALARDIVATKLTPGGTPGGEWEPSPWGGGGGRLPTETYTAVRWALGLGPRADWFA